MDWIDAEVLQVVQETPLDRSLVLGLRGDAPFHGRPGQHVMLEDPASTAERRGAYSISSLPGEKDRLEITVRDHGDLGTHFYGLEVGHPLRVKGPRGRFVLDLEKGQQAVLAAYGPSAAPYRAFVRELRERRHEDPVALLHLVDSRDHVLFQGELERHAGECGWFRYTPLLAADPTNPVLEPAVLEALLEDRARTIVFACGANAFVDDVVTRATAAGLPTENIRKEKWG